MAVPNAEADLRWQNNASLRRNVILSTRLLGPMNYEIRSVMRAMPDRRQTHYTDEGHAGSEIRVA